MSIKKLYILFSMLFCMFGTKALAYDIAVKNSDGVTIYYNCINDGKDLEVTFMDGNNESYRGSVVIPEEIATLNITRKVTSIGGYAFRGCSGLTSITIPQSVTSIGWYAFEGCTGLTSITTPNSVTSIGDSAFRGCSGLTSVTIGNSVTTIGSWAFDGCSGLTSVTIPNSVTSIGYTVFAGCGGLTSIKVESGNTKYDSRDNCNAIIETTSNTLIAGCKNTTFPNSVTSIEYGAFWGCSGLISITIPNSVASIRHSVFARCTGLASIKVESGNTKYDSRDNCNAIIETTYNKLIACCKNSTIPNSVTTIGEWAFQYCTGLTSVEIPNSVTSINNNAFDGCTGLTSITIPKSVKNIGGCAFRDCRGLTSVTIPNSVTSIVNNTFEYCTSLTSVEIPNSVTSIERSSFYGCSGLTSVTIPNSVTSIGDYAFYGCRGLTSITIPNSMKKIGDNALGGWDLREVISMIENPFYIEASTFSVNTFNNATLYVPVGTIDKYKKTDGWKEFVHIEEGEPSGVTNVVTESAKELKRYTLDGRAIKDSQKGINIVKMNDGTTKKVIVR